MRGRNANTTDLFASVQPTSVELSARSVALISPLPEFRGTILQYGTVNRIPLSTGYRFRLLAAITADELLFSAARTFPGVAGLHTDMLATRERFTAQAAA